MHVLNEFTPTCEMKKLLLIAAFLPLLSLAQVDESSDLEMIRKINVSLIQNDIEYCSAYHVGIDMYSLNLKIDADYDRAYFDIIKKHVIQNYQAELKSKGYLRIRVKFNNSQRDYVLR